MTDRRGTYIPQGGELDAIDEQTNKRKSNRRTFHTHECGIGKRDDRRQNDYYIAQCNRTNAQDPRKVRQ